MTNRIRATLISISLILMSYIVVGGLLGKERNILREDLSRPGCLQ